MINKEHQSIKEKNNKISQAQSKNEATKDDVASIINCMTCDSVKTTRILSLSIYKQTP